MRTLLVSALLLLLALAMVAGCSQEQEEPGGDTNGQQQPPVEPAPTYQDTTYDTLGVDTMTPDTGATGM